MMMQVIKKNGAKAPFDPGKITAAAAKSAARVMKKLTDDQNEQLVASVLRLLGDADETPVANIHCAVETALDEIDPAIAKSYRDYRNYKLEFAAMLDRVYRQSQSIRYLGDRGNANTDSALVSTQRSLIYNELNTEFYKRFFLTPDELSAIDDGYIYIHDKNARLDTFNCCIADIESIITGGFEMGNVWYNEPKTLDVAFDVVSDVVMSMAAMQYGGFTIPEVDKLLAPYAQRSYNKYFDEYTSLFGGDRSGCREQFAEADEWAMKHVLRDMEQGVQAWEYRFNTVGSSRGDYPFIAASLGLGQGRFEQLLTRTFLRVRAGGQGKEGFRKVVLFPKLTFLYDKNLHGEGKPLEHLFNEAVECSRKSMYPDYLSLTTDDEHPGYIPSMYEKYGKVVSLMGCRASLSPWYERGGIHPADPDDSPVFVGRFNLGVVSLHLPMIYEKARHEGRDFYAVLDDYLQMIRSIHIRTFNYLGEKRASTNPLAFCEGGVYGGHLKPDEKIRRLLYPMTLSYGITALNELQVLHNGKSIVEDGQFALEVMEHINEVVNRYKEEDGLLYAIYGTPAETLAGKQVEQFRKKYGIIAGVSDRSYVSNSFHCGVWEDISPIEKQDLEYRFWNYFNGGKIQYCRYPIDYNVEALKTLIRRAMDMGFYEGVNLALSYCESCGYEQLEMDVCPKCGSTLITKIDRMNGLTI